MTIEEIEVTGHIDLPNPFGACPRPCLMSGYTPQTSGRLMEA